MPIDETIRLQEDLLGNYKQNDQSVFFLTSKPVYNIDDMDHASFMRDHRMEGVFVIGSKIIINPAKPGYVYVNGEATGEAIVSANLWGGGSSIGLPVRKVIRDYGKEYHIRYEGAETEDGQLLSAYEFKITSLPKIIPGEKYPEHDALVLQAARESAVLLKNSNLVLPLKKGSVVNAFGKGGPTFRLGCVGAGKINPRYGIRFEEGIKTYSTLKLNDNLFNFYRNETNDLPTQELMEEALGLSDVAVIILTRGTGESVDNKPEKGEYYLTDKEHELLAGVSANFKKTIVILNIGYPIEMKWVETYRIDSVLWCGLSGMAGGRALAEILEGTISPSGKLPDTWTYNYYDIPASKNFYITPQDVIPTPFATDLFVNTVYEEDLYVGYRYFETFKKPYAFAFGHGLSYTTFSKECTSVSVHNANVSCDIKVVNTGAVSGKEVVLLFAEIQDGKLEQSTRRLVAFAKTDLLAPGAKEVIHFEIHNKRFNSYDESSASWMIEQGIISLYIGGSVAEGVKFYDFQVKEEIITEKVKNRIQPACQIATLSKKNPEGTYPTGNLSGLVKASELPYRRLREMTPEKRPVTADKPEELITFPMLVKDKSLIDAFVAQLTDYELCRMSVGARVGWGAEDNGFAGTLYTEGALSKYLLPEYYMADGNNGLNMHDATIGFPVSNSMCATFNEALSYAEGRALATEAIDMNLQCILAPAMNLHRNPLCGRHAEYFSEDPYLAGRMGGMESKGIESMGIASVMKHFIANNAENFRNRNQSIITERAARELYLKVFEVAMEVNMPDAMMTGYNPANGCWCAGDEELLEGILREEWGFTGYVMTDWGSSACCPPAPTVQAGNSWIAPGGMDDKEVTPILDGIANGTVDKERLKRNVRDMYSVIAKYYS